MTSQRMKLGGVAIVAVVMLQALTAVLMWQLLDETRDGESAAPQRQEESDLPPLPESRSGGSARALIEELDATTRRLEEPLRQMQSQLESTTSQFSSLPALPPLLAQIGGNTAGFAALPAQLDALIAQTRTLGVIPEALNLVLAELRRLRGLSTAIGRIEPGLARLENGLSGIGGGVDDVVAVTTRLGGSFDRTVAVLERMAADVARMRECIETPGVCNAQTPLGGP